MVWDEETIRHLKDFWAQGLSTAEIGRRISVSKNAVVGKAHRLELDARPSPIRREAPKPLPERSLGCPRMAGPTLPPLPSASVPPMALISDGQADFATPPLRFGQHSVEQRFDNASYGAETPAGGSQPAHTPTGQRSVGGNQAGHALAGQRSVGDSQATRMPTGEGGPMRAALTIGPRPVVAPPLTMPAPRPVMPSSPILARRPAPSCCWPIGEPGTKTFRFCEDTSMPGKPYCDEHAKLAYVKIRDRKDDAA
jgi:GcrA cell cycle regulator